MSECGRGVEVGNNPIPGARLDRAFERWHAAKTQLAKAIQEFSNASSILNKETSLPYSVVSSYVDLEANLAALDVALEETSQDNHRLSEDCAKLKTIRNRSLRMAPITSSRKISSVASSPGATRKDVNETRYALVFSSVCSSWRRTVINTPSFWSHLDLSIVSGRYVVTEYAKLAAQRANDTPIDLHIVCKDGEELCFIDKPVNLTLLPDNLRRCTLASLNLVLRFQSTANHIMYAWIHNFGSSTSLVVKLENTEHASQPELVYSTSNLELLYSKLHLHSLELSNVPMHWELVSFSGLRNLKLSNMAVSASNKENWSRHQLRDILAACPELRTLELFRITFEYSEPPEPLEPIEMPKLTHLSVDWVYLDRLEYLVNLITPGPEFSSLAVRDVPRGSPEMTFDLLEPWCEPYNIGTLSLGVENTYLPAKRLGQFLSSFKHLHTLNLSCTSLYSDEALNLFCPQEIPPNQSCLQRLRLHQCCMTTQGLRRILSTHPITWLRIDQCPVYGEESMITTTNMEVEFHSRIPDDVRAWLADAVPELYIDHGFEVVNMSGRTVRITGRGLPSWIPSFGIV